MLLGAGARVLVTGTIAESGRLGDDFRGIVSEVRRARGG